MTEYKYVELLKNQIADFKRAVNAVKPMNSDYLTGYISALSVIEGVIAEQPTADVAKVVMCRDCKYYDKKYHQCKLHSEEPDQYNTGFIFNMQEDDFCSYGERIVGNEVE